MKAIFQNFFEYLVIFITFVLVFSFIRRTADVKSVGYSELFVLSREDVLGALKDHPEAEVKNML